MSFLCSWHTTGMAVYPPSYSYLAIYTQESCFNCTEHVQSTLSHASKSCQCNLQQGGRERSGADPSGKRKPHSLQRAESGPGGDGLLGSVFSVCLLNGDADAPARLRAVQESRDPESATSGPAEHSCMLYSPTCPTPPCSPVADP